jgi:hypothetical protein
MTLAYASLHYLCMSLLSSYIQAVAAVVERQLQQLVSACSGKFRSAYVSIRQHTSAYVSIQAVAAVVERQLQQRQQLVAACSSKLRSAYVSIRQHTSAYVSIRHAYLQ